MRTVGLAGTPVTRTYLELRSITELRPSGRPEGDPTLTRIDQPTAVAYRALYELVGASWHWRDRGRWSDAELAEYLASPDVRIHELRLSGECAGYFELKRQSADTVEIMYFGLVPRFMGRGLGGWMLTRAVQEGGALGATRVILNTCTLDAPAALPNYLARGFRIIREEQYVTTSA